MQFVLYRAPVLSSYEQAAGRNIEKYWHLLMQNTIAVTSMTQV